MNCRLLDLRLATVIVTRSTFPELFVLAVADARMWATVTLLCGGLAGGGVALATYRIIRPDPWAVLRQP